MPDDLVQMRFPSAGLDVVNAFMRQPNRPVGPDQQYRRTTPLGVNVRGWEPITDRMRGGSRGGLTKVFSHRPGNVQWITQNLSVLSGTGYNDPGNGLVQTSQSGRVVTVVVVSQGNVYTCPVDGDTWTAATNSTGNSPPLNYSGLVRSAPSNQKLYFADSINYCYYDPSDSSVKAWVASAGSLPVDSDFNTPRLICLWRGRILLSGLIKDPQNVFASAIADPTDFDYFPVVPLATQAWALNLAPLGLIGDTVTSLIPFNDDVCIVGLDHSIYAINGDPAAGGGVLRVSDGIGMAFGTPWAKDPAGNIYFFSNTCSIFLMAPNGQPQRISQSIEPLLKTIDTGLYEVIMAWDDRTQSLHVYVSLLSAPDVGTHFTWEWRSGAWFIDRFANVLHNPVCCCNLDGNTAADRIVLLGGWDGYVRSLSSTATDDDGTAIFSSVLIGPLVTKDFDDLKLHELQAIMGETSGSVSFSICQGRTAEQAASATGVRPAVFAPGRNLTQPIALANHGTYVKIDAVGQWAMEAIRARVESLGEVRRRGR